MTTTTTTKPIQEDFSPIDKVFSIHSFYGCNLILPAVSIGNVGQLAIDLLIQTLTLSKVGYFDDSDVVPVIGRAEDGKNLSTALEVYHSSELKLVVIQQRSPVLRDARTRFAKRILSFCNSAQINQIILLSSIDGAYRLDSQLGDDVFRALKGSNNSPLAEVPDLEQDNREREVANSDPSLPLLRHGGITRVFMSVAKQLEANNVSALITFAIEGDNVPDAVKMADRIDQLLHVRKDPTHWKSPESWKGLFGNSLEQTLYQ